MKHCIFIIILLALCSCNSNRVEILRLVNDQNDGWNAFNIYFLNDSVYQQKEFISDRSGKYSIRGNEIYFTSGFRKGQKMKFMVDPNNGCIYNPEIMDEDNSSTNMRVIFDSVFCNDPGKCDTVNNSFSFH